MLEIKKVDDFIFDPNNENASLRVKVGELECVLEFLKTYKGEIALNKPTELDVLEKATGDIDYSFLVEEYKEQLVNLDEIRKQQKKKKAEHHYDNFWGSKNNFSHDKVKLVVQPKEDYLKSIFRGTYGGPDVHLVYKDYKISVRYEDVSRAGWYRSPKNMKYTISHEITNYKSRNYKTLEKAANKIVELVNELEEKQKSDKEREQKVKKAKQNKLNRLKGLFGNVIVESRYVSGYMNRSKGYYVEEYFIVNGENKYRISDTNEDDLYHFAGLGKLEVKRINQILDILKQQ